VEQALLVAPMFGARWRWNATRALGVLRQRNGKRVPPPLQRMRSDDLMAAVFPRLVACQENVTGPIELPDHPLVRQTVHDCLTEAMDVEGLAAVPHLQRLRIHSRIPMALPDRMTPLLIRRLTHTRLPVVMVIHCNHPNEIDAEVEQALSAMQRAGITLLNQSVLLRGVNDNPDVLAALSERLFAARVLPYYLHLLDPVRGAAHFDVPEPEARRIMHDLSSRLPGYLVPRLVREQAGAPYKLHHTQR